MTARVTNAQLMDRLLIIDDRTEKLELATFGDNNGTLGIVRRQDRHEFYWRVTFRALTVVGAVLMLLFSIFLNHSYASWEATTRIENDMAALSYEVMEAEPTPTVLPLMATPTAPHRPAPTPIPAFPYDEREWLARLCVVEARGMEEARDQACLSIVSTVLTRASRRAISDGTIRGTLTWGCGPETVACQFPAYTVNGCAGISAGACPLSYPGDLEHFRRVVGLYYLGDAPRCAGYLFYGIREFDRPECVIAAKNGQFLNFWERVAPHE